MNFASLASALFAASTFFLCAKRWKLDGPFSPGFLARLSLCPAYQLQQTAGAPGNIDIIARCEFSRLRQKPVRIHRVENQFPLEILLAGKHKRYRFIMGINQQQKRVVANWFAFKINNIDRVATEQHSDTANERRRPFFVAHLAPAGIEPHHIPNLRAAYPAALKEFWTAKYRMRLAKPDQLSREIQKLLLLFIVPPIEPGDLVVLTISVVIALLRSSPLVATQKHRHALRKKKCGQKIPPLPFAQSVNLGVVGWTFDAAIPGEIVVVAVIVPVAVQFIVLFVVAEQIVQRETIMRGHKIDAGRRTPPILVI